MHYAGPMPTTPAWTPPPAPHQTAIDDVVIPALGEVPPGPAAHFLAGPGRLAPGFHALLAGYAHAVRDEGIPVDRAMVVMPTLHPLLSALNFIWNGSDDVVREISRGWAATDSDEFKRSPMARLLAGSHRVIRRHLCDPASPNDFEIVNDLQQQGFTDYVITSIAPAGGHRVAALSWSTRAPGGFTDDDLRRLLATVAFFAPLQDTHAAQRVGRGLLQVYLGADAGHRVMDGAVRRGDGGDILAAICFADLRDFTALSDRLPRAELLELLSSYFDCVVGAVTAHGGEVLKFIGDAVLAIFRVNDDDRATACQAALRAAHDAFARAAASNLARVGQQPIDFGMAIHIGDVVYGNIGAPDRLDFTVIGPAVNLASRLQGQCRPLARPLLVSEAFVANCDEACLSLGEHHLKGVARAVKIFAPHSVR